MSFLRIIVNVCIVVSWLAVGLVVNGCKGEANIEDTLKNLSPLSINSYTLDNYVIPGKTAQIGSVCEPVLMGPDKPVFVWRISHNGNFIEEIIHDSDTSPFSSSSDNSTFYRTEEEEETHEKYSWPNFDELKYTFTELGTYTVETILYEYDEYSRDGNKALIVSRDSLKIYCDTIKLSVEAAPTPNVREFSFKAKVENPQFIEHGYPTKWEFVNVSTGQPDVGLTEEVSVKDSLYTAGVQEVDHVFQNAGKYKVIFTISGYESSGKNTIASAEIMVDVTSGFTIVPPPGALMTDQEYKFIARTNSPNDLTEAPSYEWDFGDGSMKIIPYSNEVIHSFNKPGKHVIYVEVFDSEEEAANVLGTAYLTINVEEYEEQQTNLGDLQQTRYVNVQLKCGRLQEISRFENGQWIVVKSDDQLFGIIGEGNLGQQSILSWQENEFSVTYNSVSGTKTSTYTISGRISSDVTVAEVITARQDYIDTSNGNESLEILTLENVPLTKSGSGSSVRYRCFINSPEMIRQYIQSYEYESKGIEQITKFTDFDWSFQIEEPTLEIILSAN